MMTASVLALSHNGLKVRSKAPGNATKDVMKGLPKMKELDGKMVDGKWVTETDVNYKNDKSQTGDWGNEYGPSKDISAVTKKDEPLRRDQTEHVDGKTETEDWR